MDKLAIMKVSTSVIISAIFIVLVFLYIKIYFSIKNEQRIKAFALESKASSDISLSDAITNFFQRIIKSLSKYVSKSYFLSNYAKRFDKYIIYTDSKLNNKDLIVLKFFIMIGFQLLYVFSLIFKLGSFNIYTFLLVSIISFFILDIVVMIAFKREKSLIEEQLLQAIVIMNSAFKSGKNITEAINIVKKELPNPIKDEFEIVSKDIAYGLSLKDAFSRFYTRVKLEQAKYITSSLTLLSKTGGNIVTVFNMIEKNFYDRLRIKNELNALTSTSKLLYRMLIIMPFLFILVIVMLSPSYFTPLVSSTIGFIIDGIMFALYILYIIIIKKVMKVDEV